MSTENKQGFRLSPQQRRIWQLQSQSSGIYAAQCSISVSSDLNAERLKMAVQEIVMANEILRTRLERRAGMRLPVQVIEPQAGFGWRDLTLTTTTENEWEKQIEELMGQERTDPAPAFPLKVVLLRDQMARTGLILTLAGTYGDAFSLRIVAREIEAAYIGLRNGRQQAQLKKEEIIQYADVAELFNNQLEADDREKEMEFWQTQLLDLSPTERLPFEVEPSSDRFWPKTIERYLNRASMKELSDLAREHQFSLPACFLASWQILLRCLGGPKDRTIGAVCSGRQYEDLQYAIGPFARTLPLKCSLRDDEHFISIASRLDDALHIAEGHQDTFSWEAFRSKGDASESVSYFSVAFEYQEERAGIFSAIEQSVFSPVREEAFLDRFKLKLTVQERNQGLRIAISFNGECFSDSDIHRIADYFSNLVQSIVSSPYLPIHELQYIELAEQQLLVLDSNRIVWEGEPLDHVHRQIERQASCYSERWAVVGEDTRLTYGALNRQANQLAHRLRRMGIGSESRVVLYLDRSVDAVVAFLGVLKSGGAYIPIDLQTPDARLAFMISDAGAELVITQQEFKQRFAEMGLPVLVLDDPKVELDMEAIDNLAYTPELSNLAYLIYTSGSTGEPKAVAVEHRQLATYVRGVTKRLDLPPGGSYALISTFAADLGNTMTFPALCSGGCLHVISQARATDPFALTDYFRRNPPDCLKITPSHLAALMTINCPADVLPRKRLILGGEATDWNLIDRIESLSPELRIDNHYGPTETTVGVLTCRVDSFAGNRFTSKIPLGKQLSDTQIYILNPRLQPVPAGVPGEIFISGGQVARGYLNRADISAERFLPNPFSTLSGDRMYRTGDSGRYTPDGKLEFLGRVDHQIKIRGYRIELREIEAALLGCSFVEQSVVIARRDALDEQRLVAYWVARPGANGTWDELRNYLRTRLPEYMIPSLFIKLEAMPLTPNGKIDRSALLRYSERESEPVTDYVPPRSSEEKKIAQIWREVLRVEHVGLYDNFFDLGGHSLLMVQVHSKLREAFDREIPMIEMFKYTTISTLAGYLANEQKLSSSSRQGESRAQMRRIALEHRHQLKELN